MSETRHPVCPICKKEVLLPFSISQYEVRGKHFGSWVCTNCGFYITTGDKRAMDPISDFETGINPFLRKEIKKIKKEYLKGSSEKSQ